MNIAFNKKTRKSCAWCLFGTKSDFSDEIFCKKRGVVGTDNVCCKYRYDVLKRTPEEPHISKNYTADDFKL